MTTYSHQASRYVARKRRERSSSLTAPLESSWFDVAAAFDAGMRFAVIDRKAAMAQIAGMCEARDEPPAPLQDSEAREQDERS